METLKVGERFPDMRLEAVDGSNIRVPDELVGVRAVLLFYRGRW
ncbi:MAG: hypothetical protein ACREM1_24220 [Longimicrobiales bacterium]